MKTQREEENTLNRTLKPIHLWGLTVGLVISGNYFGWSYGYLEGGSVGLLLAAIPVVIMFATFILCYSELATMIPSAAGGAAYAGRAFGTRVGFLAGLSSLIELLFAPPAIAIAIGGYVNNLFPVIPPIVATLAVFAIFVVVNLLGVHTSAAFEIFVTIIALFGLMAFWVAAMPHFSIDTFLGPVAENNGLDGIMRFVPNGWTGVIRAIPFAIWFYLAIEGGATSAEEVIEPQKNLSKGFLSGMLTLFTMMCFTLLLTAGIADYEIVGNVDFPLPKALSMVYGTGGITLLINVLGLFGLIASLNGVIATSSRQLFAMARAGYLPKVFAYVEKKNHTPIVAIIFVGIFAGTLAATGLTDVVINISAYGLLGLYIISLLSFLCLRKKEPDAVRPFKAPGGIGMAGISLVLCVFFMICLAVTSTGTAVPAESILCKIFGEVSIDPFRAYITIFITSFILYILISKIRKNK